MEKSNKGNVNGDTRGVVGGEGGCVVRDNKYPTFVLKTSPTKIIHK